MNKIIQHDCSKPFPLAPESIDLIVTSPPYWGLRDYGEETITTWGGRSSCNHKWGEPSKTADIRFGGENANVTNDKKQEIWDGNSKSSFCSSCNAWKGQLGLEPHPQLFLEHLWQIFDECKRVLKKEGSIYVNLGDTYYGSGGAGGDYNKGGMREGQPKFKQGRGEYPEPQVKGRKRAGEIGLANNKSPWLQPKQLMLIPSRFAIGMQERGWILRNDIIWHKPNSMPSSVKDQ